MISNALSIGVNGVQDAQRGMQDAASRIARSGTTEAPPREAAAPDGAGASEDSLAGSIVDLKVNQRNAEASIEVVRTADEMVGTLLDERA
ncbi:flagellar biosynthesis protein FlgE [Halovibrio salipaludis]|uniref:Flagellar biosynthesis protein FlgE n=1 Tax=Halovibrio salipaludis TaxID=2032626 RepID=A0A2A2EZZ0_9GAMM|nr:flagellar biosynthesis protein FlgE [Halovibrio salipaludis]PAU78746.1 flagellar biosynthesis protein FlgE [Halovibrio salipaludis]